MAHIYLDNAATTKPLEIVKEAVAKTMMIDYGNPSSYHTLGIDAEKLIKSSSEFFAKNLNCLEDEIIYTSGATESNNMAVIGTALAYKRTGKRLITSNIEHPSVKKTFLYLEEMGFEVIYLKVNEKGYIDLKDLEKSINDETILVSLIHVNNEIGTVQKIDQIGKLIKNTNKNTKFHVDAVQSFGKYKINTRESEIDLLSISAHKIYGPKGVGLLYKNKNTRIKPIVLGGNQQEGLRSGTENVPGIVGMHKAAEYVISNMEETNKHLLKFKISLANKVLESIPDSYINGPDLEEGAPHILNIGFKNIRAEILLNALDEEKIYVSSGSACSANSQEQSDTLRAIDKGLEKTDEAIRFSFGVNNKEDEIEKVCAVLEAKVPMIRNVLKLGGR